MTNTGKILKSQRSLTLDNVKLFESMRDDFVHGRNLSYYEIPSDTGLVALNKDRKLIATKNIGKGEVITYVPITKHETFSNQRIWVGSVQGSIIKKLSPFCGFGGFAEFDPTNFNCSMTMAGEKRNFVSLVASKDILPNEIITCSQATLVDRHITGDEPVDFSIIMQLVTVGMGTKPNTRSRTAATASECAASYTNEHDEDESDEDEN